MQGLDFKKLAEQLKALWGKLSGGKRTAAIAILVLTAGGLLFLGVKGPDQKEAVLYSGLEPEDAGQVLEKLAAAKIPYRLDHGGTTILVPEDKAPELRIQMASAGLPRGGSIGFEVFDKQSFGTTTFVEQMNYQRALSGELSRSIASLDAVERARVHLAMPERSLYARADEPPSASVILRLRPSRALAPQQVRGIVHLVASSVARLTPERVTVVSEGGEVLWSGDDSGGSSDSQHDLERTLAKRITDLTDRIVGPGHSVVVVTAELDQAHTERTEELYGKDGNALRSESRTEERSGSGASGAGGVSGSRANLPGAPSPGETETATKNDGRMKMSDTRNFEVNRVVNKTTGPKSQLKRLHVAIMVDGVADDSAAPVAIAPTVSAATASIAGIGPTKKPLQRPRSAEQLAQIAVLAREAAGLDSSRGDRIEVHSVPFFGNLESIAEPVPAPPHRPTNQEWLAIGGGGLGLLLLIAFLALGARKKLIIAEPLNFPQLPLRVGDAESALAQPDPGQLALPPPSPREGAMRAARESSSRAAEVIAAWLDEPAPRIEVSSVPLPQKETRS